LFQPPISFYSLHWYSVVSNWFKSKTSSLVSIKLLQFPHSFALFLSRIFDLFHRLSCSDHPSPEIVEKKFRTTFISEAVGT
jgi:hypothetical protein